MKAIYLTGEQTAEVEDIKLNKRYIQFKDGGYYLNNPGAILTHRHHKYPPIAIIWQGRSNMEGANPSTEQLAQFCMRTEACKHHRVKVGISKRWFRRLIHNLFLFVKLLIIFYVILFGLLLLVVFA